MEKSIFKGIQNLGIYVHIPFCSNKCRYCDFFSVTSLSRIPIYLDALHNEMSLCACSETRADTLYIGGGTPSLLAPRQIGRIVDWSAQYFNLQAGAEMTLEVNPATASARDLADYAAFGFNRLNIGIQSFNDRNLSFLGRIHSSEQALAAVKSAQSAGFTNIGLDLMYAIPEQTLTAWKGDLLQAIRLAPRHLSCYMLSYEPNTPLYNDRQAGRVVPVSDLRAADMFRMTHDFLGAAGYEHYEISNFAQGSGWRSRHNQKYWHFEPYIGLGPSAHSCRLPFRWWNNRSLEVYIEDLGNGNLPVSEEEELTSGQQMIESLFLGLRQADGIELSDFEKRFGVDFKLYFRSACERFKAQGWMQLDEHYCRLTSEGMLFLDRVVDELVDLIEV